MKKTIAQQLNITDFPFSIEDKNDREIYYESSRGGFWRKREYNSNGKLIYFETSNGYWVKSEFDSKGNRIYYENSNGRIIDDRPKTEIQKAIELLTENGMVVTLK